VPENVRLANRYTRLTRLKSCLVQLDHETAPEIERYLPDGVEPPAFEY